MSKRWWPPFLMFLVMAVAMMFATMAFAGDQEEGPNAGGEMVIVDSGGAETLPLQAAQQENSMQAMTVMTCFYGQPSAEGERTGYIAENDYACIGQFAEKDGRLIWHTDTDLIHRWTRS